MAYHAGRNDTIEILRALGAYPYLHADILECEDVSMRFSLLTSQTHKQTMEVVRYKCPRLHTSELDNIRHNWDSMFNGISFNTNEILFSMLLDGLMATVAGMIPAKWKDIGVQLDVPYAQLDGFQSECPHNNNCAYRKMFTYWITEKKSLFHWQAVYEVLKSPCVDELSLVETINHQHYDEMQLYTNKKDNTSLELRDLMNKVGCLIPDKWKDIGIQLNISYHRLKDIQSEVAGLPNRNQQAFYKVFHYWKTKKTSPYTWETIIKALEAPAVGENRLANDLKVKHVQN